MSWPKPFAVERTGNRTANEHFTTYQGVALGDHHALLGGSEDVAKIINEAFEEHTRTLVAGYRELWKLVVATAQAHDEGYALPRTLTAQLSHLDHLDPAALDLPEYVPADWLGGAAFALGLAEGVASRQLRVIEMALEEGGVNEAVRVFARACRLQNELLILETKEKQDGFVREIQKAAAPHPILSTMAATAHPTILSMMASVPSSRVATYLEMVLGQTCPTCRGNGQHPSTAAETLRTRCPTCRGTGHVLPINTMEPP